MFKRMKLKNKIALGFGFVSLVAVALGVLGYYGAVTSDEQISEIGKVRLPGVDSLLVIKQNAENIRGTMRTLGISGLPQEIRQRQYSNLVSAREQYEKAWKTYESLPKTAEEADLWNQLLPVWTAWRGENNKYVELCKRFDGNGILDPIDLGRLFEGFTKDHYKLSERVLHMLLAHQTFEGGEDHTACACGKWLPTFKTENTSLAAAAAAIAEPHKRFHESVKHLKQLIGEGKTDEAVKAYEEQMVAAGEQVLKQFDTMLKVANDSIAIQQEAAAQLLGPLTDKQQAANELLDKLVQSNRDVAARTCNSAQAQSAFMKTVSLGAMLLGVVVSIILAVLITRSIIAPFKEIFKGLKSLSTTELADTGRTFKRIIGGLTESVSQVNDAAGQVSASSQQLAEGASEQASSLEETSSALEEMAAMTRTNAANAKQADDLACQARQAADEGEKTMTEISDSSDQISKIIKVIEEIAFQTNLLALNAAVEAARAGEHGKGFAVVADEVRNLAQRAAQAAKETTGLIENSVNKSKEGTEAIKAIVGNVAKLTDLINGIAKASDEQAQGVDQVNTAVAQMDKVTQQNASGAEESASAAEELSAQAEAVNGLVGELVTLIEGNDGHHVGRGGSPASKAKRPVVKVAHLTHQPAVKASRSGGAGAAKPSNEPGAEEFLPLAEDEDLKEF